MSQHHRVTGARAWQRIRMLVLERAGYRCEACGKIGARWEIHHKVKLRDGGSNDLENLECLCRDCHFAQHVTKKVNPWARLVLELMD